MIISKWSRSVSLCLLAFALGSGAQETESQQAAENETVESPGANSGANTAQVLSDMLVTGFQRPSPDATKIKPQEVTPRVGTDVVDSLEHEPGIDIQRRSLLSPKSKMLRLRGYTTEKTLVTRNGRPLNGAGVYGGYQIDWSLLSLSSLDHVEVIRGADMAEYGDTAGGVINLVSKRPSKSFSGTASYGYKEFGTYEFRASVSDRLNLWSNSKNRQPFGFTLGAGYLDTNGYLRNSEGKRTDFAPAFFYFFPGGGELKLGLHYQEGTFETPVTNQPGDADYKDDYPDSEGSQLVGPGVRPAPATRQSMTQSGLTGVVYGDDSYYTKERYSWDLTLEKKLGWIDWTGHLYYDTEDRTDKYYARTDVGATSKGDLIFEKNCPPNTTWGWKITGKTMLKKHELRFGIDGRTTGYKGIEYEFTDQNYLQAPPSGTKNPDQEDIIEHQGAFIADTYRLTDSLEVYGGLRYDDYNAASLDAPDKNFETWSPKFRLSYWPLENLETYVSYARATSFPIIPKYYWYYNGLQPGMGGIPFKRPPLDYEDSDQYEWGARYNGFRNTEIAVNAFHYKTDNYLRWIFGYPRSRVVYNMDNVEITGLELSLKRRIVSDLQAYANWTYQTEDVEGTILADNTMDDLGLPDHKVNLGLKYKPAKNMFAQLAVKYVDQRQEALGPQSFGGTDMQVADLDSYWRVDVRAKYPLSEYANLSVGCENLLDETYEQTHGFPMPGRMFFGQVEVVF